jgi:hypothetical protein
VGCIGILVGVEEDLTGELEEIAGKCAQTLVRRRSMRLFEAPGQHTELVLHNAETGAP